MKDRRRIIVLKSDKYTKIAAESSILISQLK
jgi:hypothetical protein